MKMIYIFSLCGYVVKIIIPACQSWVRQTDGEMNVVTLLLRSNKLQNLSACYRALSTRTNKNCLCTLMLLSFNETHTQKNICFFEDI